MQKYQSHKTVGAAKIEAVSYYARSETTPLTDTTPVAQFSLGDGGCVTGVTHGWMKKNSGSDYNGPDGVDLVGGYYVEYEDGYTSWSPAGAFENGYTPISTAAQGLPVAGYKPTQPGWAIEAVNGLKHAEERAHRLLDELVAKGEAVDQRAVALARTGLQQAFMWAARGVFQPTRVQLPEDNAPLFPSDAKGG